MSEGVARYFLDDRTWTAKVLGIVLIVAISYGVWYDYADSLDGLGDLFGGDLIYQPWNILGHFIPALFMLLFFPKKIEMFLAAFLISTVVMDTPIWGMEKLYLHHQSLWDQKGKTNSLYDWIAFYYNPVGFYGVWKGNFPTASVIFFSIVGRLGAAAGLIWYQHRIELSRKTRVSLNKMIKRDY
ncbi:MAG TPA: hypothetical protein VH500_14010 [Nitrososphaeraceae archaeon]